MKFFQKIKDSAGKVTDRAQNVVEIGKLNTQISNIEREMGLYFQRMGEVFYEGYRIKDMSNAEKEMIELAKTCDLLAEERDEVRVKIAELKNERLCGACGKKVGEDALFCHFCGHKLLKDKGQDYNIGAEFTAGLGGAEEESISEDKGIFTLPVIDEGRASEEKIEPLDPVTEARHLRELERERQRQEELDLRIRTWKENLGNNDSVSTSTESPVVINTVNCQICTSSLVKGTKWCPNCGAEQI
ncbi:zinc ribbon domain-containing protein [Paenibacillus segetis]|uniref:Zinc ribbon domain-containing protein n=1 Tax=Paenibacillus segetis TaxID=1325360 RepID=A0ABQ1YUY7_9BACL|nr:zinc ribbon domain-containing protein [Paenibacillus segetis]GGH38033.1 hypothetical protein GCM10008013_45860 [Paenibacillus segetis]